MCGCHRTREDFNQFQTINFLSYRIVEKNCLFFVDITDLFFVIVTLL